MSAIGAKPTFIVTAKRIVFRHQATITATGRAPFSDPCQPSIVAALHGFEARRFNVHRGTCCKLIGTNRLLRLN
jgi:hypothetical protein